MSSLNEEINLLSELDNVSRIHFLDREDIDQIMIDMARQVQLALRIERINVWLFNKDKSALISVGEYDKRTSKFNRNSILRSKDFPVYFEALAHNKIIHAPDINSHPATSEFKDLYSIPNDVHSLLDIPLRISGELIGVMCYEKTGAQKIFSDKEIQFCLSVSFIVASNFEARYRRAVQAKLEAVIKEKDLLLAEVNHRVKNNFAILISLMRLSYNKAQSNEVKELLQDYEQRLFSMLKIHDLLNTNNLYSEIDLVKYLQAVADEFVHSYPEFSPLFKISLDNLTSQISTKKVIHLGLMVTEILLNIAKHKKPESGLEIMFSLHKINDHLAVLCIGDNGKGFNFNNYPAIDGLGLAMIKDLADSLGVKSQFPKLDHCYYSFELEL